VGVVANPSESYQFNLVTAANANLLSEYRPNLLMGTWCTYSNVKSPISEDDFALIAAQWGSEKGHATFAEYEVKQICDKLLSKLVTKLNVTHELAFTGRTWEIILGPWLELFVGYIYRRSSTLNEVLQSHDVSSVKCFTVQASRVQVQDTNDFIMKTMDPVWQSMVDAILINVITKKNVYLELIPAPVEEPLPLSKSRHSESLKKVISSTSFQKKVVRYVISQSLERLSTSKLLNSWPTKYYLQATYLPILVEIRLHLLLGQVPKIRWIASKNSQPGTPADKSIRRILFEGNVDQSLTFVEACMNEALIHLFPTSYLEGFEDLIQSVKRANLPRYPKVIFTSNSYFTDEVFKVWAGLETQRGAKYIVGQHGNNYGTWMNLYATEQRTADQFLSWGWIDDSNNTRPTFNLKSSGRKEVSTVGDGILLIQDGLAYPTQPRDTDLDFAQNLQKQFNFIDLLPSEIRKVITIRLHASAVKSTFDVIGEWKEFLERYPDIKLDLGDSPIRKLISKHALVIHCYDSTGMLETFAEDIPSIAYVPGGLEHLNDAARIRYRALEEAGLLYLSANLAAEALSRIYPDVKEWWKSNKVVAEKKIFINSYSKISNRPARELATILKKVDCLES